MEKFTGLEYLKMEISCLHDKTNEKKTWKERLDYFDDIDLTKEGDNPIGLEAALDAYNSHVLAAKKEVSKNRAGFAPRFSIGLTQLHQDIGYANTPRPSSDTSTIVLKFSQPIYQGGGISAKSSCSISITLEKGISRDPNSGFCGWLLTSSISSLSSG